jgi:DNA-binding MarR family transcriptional regulator
VADFYPAEDDQARLRWIIIDALRRYGTDSGRIGHAFAELHRLQAADLRALVAIMSAEGNGAPLTAGQLREQLGLSSGGASLVIDRLEQAGHIRRARDHPADNRIVHLRYTDQGRATGLAFFGSLGDRAHAILDGFTDDELQVIARFITAMAESAHQHLREVEDRPSGRRSPPRPLSAHLPRRGGLTGSCRSAEGVGFEPTRNVTAPNGFQEHPWFVIRHGHYLGFQHVDPLRCPRSSRVRAGRQPQRRDHAQE